jgi:glutathione S-transferase
MKLYSYPAAPNPRRVHVFLAEKGIEIPVESVDLMKGEQFAPSYRAINPLLTVPALVTDEGPVLAQVSAICGYLEARFPEPALLGRTPLEQALVREWCHRVFVEGMSAIADVFRNGNPAFAHRALPGPVDLEQIPALVERGLQRLDAFWKTLDTHLAGRDHMVGDAFTMADIDAVVSCDFARWIRKPIPEECANLRRWHAAMSARASFGPSK